MNWESAVSRTAGTFALKRYLKPLSIRYLARKFYKAPARRLLIYCNVQDISWAQVYPFLYFADQLGAEYDVQVRCLPVDDFLKGRSPSCGAADIVLIQPWFTVERLILGAAIDQFANRFPAAQLSFIDSYAHNDLRLGDVVEPYIKYYFKKSLFKDRRAYLRPYFGDTNLTEYYGLMGGLAQGSVNWNTPAALLDKLRLSPNFHLSPRFLNPLGNGHCVTPSDRSIDLHSRFGIQGTPWYTAMREHASSAAAGIEGIRMSAGGWLSPKTYAAELAASKLCFSPFGYGELCWRDIEAIVSGAALIKPCMDHLETLPYLYEDGVTYRAVKWDFSNLAEVVHAMLGDPEGTGLMARTAHARISKHANEAQFVQDVRFLFEASN